MRFIVEPDGSIANGEVFFDSTLLAGSGAPDGMKLDINGNLYCTGPGGILVLTRMGNTSGRSHLQSSRPISIGVRRTARRSTSPRERACIEFV